MRHEEIEVKFLIDDLPRMRQRLLALGALLKTPRTFEENLLFDTPDQRLTQQQRVLRLRRDRRNLITYKEPPVHAETDFKMRSEYEIEVSDFALTQVIFAKLGLVPTMRYEKYRETLTYRGDTEIVLDEVPFGTFMEIEGSQNAIRHLAAALGLEFTTRLVASYAEIFAAVCATYGLQGIDMTFAAFQGLTIDLRTCPLR